MQGRRTPANPTDRDDAPSRGNAPQRRFYSGGGSVRSMRANTAGRCPATARSSETRRQLPSHCPPHPMLHSRSQATGRCVMRHIIGAVFLLVLIALPAAAVDAGRAEGALVIDGV